MYIRNAPPNNPPPTTPFQQDELQRPDYYSSSKKCASHISLITYPVAFCILNWTFFPLACFYNKKQPS